MSILWSSYITISLIKRRNRWKSEIAILLVEKAIEYWQNERGRDRVPLYTRKGRNSPLQFAFFITNYVLYVYRQVQVKGGAISKGKAKSYEHRESWLNGCSFLAEEDTKLAWSQYIAKKNKKGKRKKKIRGSELKIHYRTKDRGNVFRPYEGSYKAIEFPNNTFNWTTLWTLPALL